MIKRAPLELPPNVARGFMDDMWAYFAEEDPNKRDVIAVRQRRVTSRCDCPT